MVIRDNNSVEKEAHQAGISNRPVENSNLYISNANEYFEPRFTVY